MSKQPTTPDYLSNSLTVSTKTEAMLVYIKGLYCFVEYPTNRPPSINSILDESGGGRERIYVSYISEINFTILQDAFCRYEELKQIVGFLHTPSFLYGWCYSRGFDLKLNNILI